MTYTISEIKEGCLKASDSVAHIATLLRFSGSYAKAFGPNDTATGLSGSQLGGAVAWAGHELERHAAEMAELCTSIQEGESLADRPIMDEGLSHARQ